MRSPFLGVLRNFFFLTKGFLVSLFFFSYQHSEITAGRRHCVSALNVLCSKYPHVKSDPKKSSSFGRWRTFRVSSVSPQKLFLSSWGLWYPALENKHTLFYTWYSACHSVRSSWQKKKRNASCDFKENKEVAVSKVFPLVQPQHSSPPPPHTPNPDPGFGFIYTLMLEKKTACHFHELTCLWQSQELNSRPPNRK